MCPCMQELQLARSGDKQTSVKMPGAAGPLCQRCASGKCNRFCPSINPFRQSRPGSIGSTQICDSGG